MKLKQYLSYSQIMLWQKSKKEYIKKYFDEVETYLTDQMAFGKWAHERLEEIYGTDMVEYEIELQEEINGVLVKGYIDMYSKERNTIYEFKTGKDNGAPWTQERVDSHLQLHIYYLLMLKRNGIAPKIMFGQIPQDENFSIADIEYIEYIPDQKKLKRAEEIIKKTREEINKAYDEWIVDIKEEVKELDEFIELKKKQEEIEERINELKEILQETYPEGIKTDKMNMYTITKKTYKYEGLEAQKQELDKKSAEYKEACKVYEKNNDPESVSITYGYKIV